MLGKNFHSDAQTLGSGGMWGVDECEREGMKGS